MCLRKTAATLSLLMLFLLTASGGTVSSTKLRAHGATAPNGPAIVLRVKLLLGKDSPVLEITFTRPIRPLITRIQDPPGLRIDLNNAKISVRHKEIAVQSPSDRSYATGSVFAESLGCEDCGDRIEASELHLGCCGQPALH